MTDASNIWRNFGPDDATPILHACAVDYQGKGVLILGPTGSGKSSLALQLMAHGAQLVSDDRTMVRAENGRLLATCPDAISGRIEARGIGLLAAQGPQHTFCWVVVDLSESETSRLPEPVIGAFLNCDFTYFKGKGQFHLAAGLIQYLKAGFANYD